MGKMLHLVQHDKELLAIPVFILPAIPIFAILAIFPIAVVIPILALVHVDAVDDDAQVGDVLVALDVVDEVELVLTGVVCTTDVDAEVCGAGDKLSVRNHADGCTVKDDIVKVLPQDADGGIQ